jgi:anti-sigma factor RsiW
MMTDEDFEKLSLYVDDALPADEAAAVAARITADAEWATAHRTMRRSGEMLRAHADATVAAVDAEALFARVNAELDRRAAGAARAAAVHAESERPGLLRWLSTLLSPPVMLGLAGAAAATAFFVLRQRRQTPGSRGLNLRSITTLQESGKTVCHRQGAR